MRRDREALLRCQGGAALTTTPTLAPQSMQHVLCKFFSAGHCAYGDQCAYGHAAAAPAEGAPSKKAQKRANSLAKRKEAEAEVAKTAAAKAKAEADSARAAAAKVKVKAKAAAKKSP